MQKARGFASLLCFYCLLHRHLLVIAQIDALWQTGEVGAYVLAVERVDLIGCWVIGVG